MNIKFNRFEINVKSALALNNRVLIHGLPGVGKTQFCYRFCKKSKKIYTFIDCEYDGIFLKKIYDLIPSGNFKDEFMKLCGIMETNVENAIIVVENIECSEFFCEKIYSRLRDLGFTLMMTMRVKNSFVSDIVNDNTVCVLRPSTFFDILRNAKQHKYIEMLIAHTGLLTRLPSLYHNDFSKEYEAFLSYGGLPNAYRTYINKSLTFEELKNVHESQYIYALEKLLEHSDLDELNRQYCRQVCNSVLKQMLDSDYYRFNFSNIRKGATMKIYGQAINFLIENNFLIKINKIDDERFFILYFYDGGVLYDKLLQLSNSSMDETVLEHILYIVKRNRIANELIDSNMSLYYWKSDYAAFIDFVVKNKNNTYACKIAEKDDVRCRSLDVYAAENINVTSVIISGRNFDKQNRKVYLPDYAIACIDEILV